MSILRELLRGVRLDPRSMIGVPLETLQGALRDVAQCIDISDLPTELLKPPAGEEHAMPPFPLCWVEAKSEAASAEAHGALVEHQGSITAVAHRETLVNRILQRGDTGLATADGLIAHDVRNLARMTADMTMALQIRCYAALNSGRWVAYIGDAWVPMRGDGCMYQSSDGGVLKIVSVTRYAAKIEGSINAAAAQVNLAVMGTRIVGLYSLLNCRNIELAERDPQPVKRHRAGKTGITWKVLHVRPMGKRAAAGERGQGDRLTRAHLVRGHFRTYTAEAPLLGKAVGRFWFSPHVRGNAERGAVIKDYAVDG